MKKQRFLVILFWGGVLALLFVGLALYFDLHKKNSIADTVLVQVNGDELTAREFSEKLSRALQDYDSLLVQDSHIVTFAKNKIVDAFIHDSLIKHWASQNSISVSEEEIAAEVGRIRANYPDDASFQEALAQSQQELSMWENQIGSKLLQKKVFVALSKKTTPPEEEELRSYYNNNRDEFKEKSRVRIRQIVFDNEDQANRLYHSLTQNSSFEDLAKKYSVAPEGPRGGDLGWIELGSLEIFDRAFNMRIGQRSPVLKSPFGYHIYEVLGKKQEETLPFDQVRAKISRILAANKEQAIYSAWLEEQLRASKVYKNNEAIGAIHVRPLGE